MTAEKIEAVPSSLKELFSKCLRILLWLVPVGVLLNMVAGLWFTDRSIFSSISKLSFGYLLPAALLSLVPWMTNTLRLKNWSHFLDRPLSLSSCMRIVLSADVGAAAVPTLAGGGYVKMGLLMEKGFTTGTATSLMLLGTIEDMIFFALALPAAAFLTNFFTFPPALKQIILRLNDNLFLLICVIILLTLTVWVLRAVLNNKDSSAIFRSRWTAQAWRQGLKIFQDLAAVYILIGRRGKRRVLVNLLLAVIQWFARYSIISVLLLCFNVQVNPVKFFLLQWMTYLTMAFIPTPGGTLGAEAAFLMVFNGHIPTNILGLAVSSWRFLTFYLPLCLAAGFLLLVQSGPFRRAT